MPIIFTHHRPIEVQFSTRTLFYTSRPYAGAIKFGVIQQSYQVAVWGGFHHPRRSSWSSQRTRESITGEITGRCEEIEELRIRNINGSAGGGFTGRKVSVVVGREPEPEPKWEFREELWLRRLYDRTNRFAQEFKSRATVTHVMELNPDHLVLRSTHRKRDGEVRGGAVEDHDPEP